MVTFMLGSHMPSWLAVTDVPMFISRHRLAKRKTFPRALGSWSLDSGGFSELSLRGKWTITPRQYVAEVLRFSQEIGNMKWAAAQDWMCEPAILKQTGLTILEHQSRTVCNYLTLREMAPEIPWVPVLQGWRHNDYFNHIGMYDKAGVDLDKLPLVGLGSVCRRQHTGEIEWLIRQIVTDYGLRLHGFGFKILGLERVADALSSADSMAWSMAARREKPLPGCSHTTCANCLRYALNWRRKLLYRIKSPVQGSLFGNMPSVLMS